MSTLRQAWQRFKQPVQPDTRQDLSAAWLRLDPEFRTPHQTIGRMEEGCGATIAAMPVCDFGCLGCYLGKNANDTPALPLADIKAQMRDLRQRLGRWGNLQLTDGEMTLRPESELIQLMRYAEEIQLIPMLMTHGETFRRKPGLLERLMAQGGLVEVSIHIDTTQRGRQADFAQAKTEADLNPLREQFANLINTARRRTGLPLRVASTCTVTPDNLDQVPGIIRWHMDHTDAFRLISFQPAAQVGRSRVGIGGGVTAEDVWDKIAQAVAQHPGTRHDAAAYLNKRWWFGHPDCSQYTTGLVATYPHGSGRPNRYEPVTINGHPTEQRVFDQLFKHFGGVSFRKGSPLVYAAQTLGMLRLKPRLILKDIPALAWQMTTRYTQAPPTPTPPEAAPRQEAAPPQEAAPEASPSPGAAPSSEAAAPPGNRQRTAGRATASTSAERSHHSQPNPGLAARLKFLAGWALGRTKLNPLTIVTHQFMSQAQIQTPAGQERIRNCIFTVPIDGELISMCEVNALGIRNAVYDRAAGKETTPPLELVDLTIGT